MTLATQAPYAQYFDADGKPLDAGSVYFGTVNDNPLTSPVSVYWDRAGLQPASQPIRTLNGYLVRNGTPAVVYVDGNYSQSVISSKGLTIYYVPDASSLSNDSVLQAAVTTLQTYVANLSNTTDPTKGPGMLSYDVDLDYPDGSVGDKLRQLVSVKDFGAKGDGVTNDTAAFLAAAAVSQSVYVPPSTGSYAISNLNLPAGVRIWGAGKIKTSGGTVIDLSTTSLDVDGAPQRIMFIESNQQGWEELLDIKSCGYSTIMAYLWNTNLADVIANAEAVGLKVIVHAKFTSANQDNWSALATAAVAFDARVNVVAYYVFDEPVENSITVENQDSGLTLFRTLTDKPLACSESSVSYSITSSLSTNYDVIFIDVYYPNASTTANAQIATFIRDIVAYGAASPRAKLIPLVGLFNDTGFTKTPYVTVQLAKFLTPFSTDATFGVFCWNAGTAGTYQGVRNVSAYRAAAKWLARSVQFRKPWKVELIAIGTLFTASNRLASVYLNTVDGTTPGMPAASNLVPWYVQNVGSAVDLRRQTFTDNGLMYKGTAARAGFAGMPSGICCAYLRWDNRETGIACTVSLGSSSTLGYSEAAAITQVIANGTAVAFFKQLDIAGSFTNMPVIDVTTASALNFPFSFLKGYLAFTDVPEVSF